MHPGDNDGLSFRPHAEDPVAAKAITQDDEVPVFLLSPVDLFLDDRSHFLRSPVEGLFQKNERDPIAFKLEQFIPHDVASNDKVFHLFRGLESISFNFLPGIEARVR